MNRRELFRGIVGVGAGLVLPASLEANAETARRWWALGSVPRVEELGRVNDEAMRYMLARQEFFIGDTIRISDLDGGNADYGRIMDLTIDRSPQLLLLLRENPSYTTSVSVVWVE